MTMTTLAQPEPLEMIADVIFCGRCVNLIPVTEVLDSVAARRPDDECPRCRTRSLILADVDGLDLS